MAALAKKIRGDRIKTFAVGYGEEAFSELGYARQVAEHIQSEHHEVRLNRDEFFASLPKLIKTPSAMATLARIDQMRGP